ncbi:hypothetical protein [Roseovarius spongiae]|uniref:hypothetical protein n=1 Tax=Roseovarius spongiae TaxID=2320272 RepID=UPI001FEC89CC|nr:hypothetical protein [Roseovarius spongiae]
MHWGLPILFMLAVIGVSHPAKTLVWFAALVWMGGACFRNARRCGRRHCCWTGSFFLLMTLPVLAHGYGVVTLGAEGWKWLGLSTGIGIVVITAITERHGK